MRAREPSWLRLDGCAQATKGNPPWANVRDHVFSCATRPIGRSLPGVGISLTKILPVDSAAAPDAGLSPARRQVPHGGVSRCWRLEPIVVEKYQFHAALRSPPANSGARVMSADALLRRACGAAIAHVRTWRPYITVYPA